MSFLSLLIKHRKGKLTVGDAPNRYRVSASAHSTCSYFFSFSLSYSIRHSTTGRLPTEGSGLARQVVSPVLDSKRKICLYFNTHCVPHTDKCIAE